jgi:hypothetical protein
MPTLKEAKDKVRELSQKGLDVFRDTTLTAAEMKSRRRHRRRPEEVDGGGQRPRVRRGAPQVVPRNAAGSPVEDAGADHGNQPGVRSRSVSSSSSPAATRASSSAASRAARGRPVTSR